MKSIKSIAAILTAAFALSGCGDDVGKVSLGMFTTSDIFIDAKQDPKLPGVTCHISHIEANFDLSDPSNMSIACRQTGPILPSQLAGLDTSKSGEIVFRESLSVLFKSLKVRRIYDKENNTLLYLSYSTKETKGSFKHSLSSVSLYQPSLATK
ncbi:MAG: CreA family protein [Psychrobium sp.]